MRSGHAARIRAAPARWARVDSSHQGKESHHDASFPCPSHSNVEVRCESLRSSRAPRRGYGAGEGLLHRGSRLVRKSRFDRDELQRAEARKMPGFRRRLLARLLVRPERPSRGGLHADERHPGELHDHRRLRGPSQQPGAGSRPHALLHRGARPPEPAREAHPAQFHARHRDQADRRCGRLRMHRQDHPMSRAGRTALRSTTYLVEHYWPGLTMETFRETAERVRTTAETMARGGTEIRYLHSTMVPEDEAAFCVLDA